MKHHEHRIKCAEDLVFYWKYLRSEMLNCVDKWYQIERMRRGAAIWKVLRNPADPEKYFTRSDRSEYSRDWREFVSAAFKLFGRNLAAAVHALQSVPPFPSGAFSEERNRIYVAHILECAAQCGEGQYSRVKDGSMIVKERPILFDGAMVRAILAGRKTQTRRVVRKETCPYGRQGERLWVREAFARLDILPVELPLELDPECYQWAYRADQYPVPRQITSVDAWFAEKIKTARWKPGIHMPRSHSRITLEITGVRQEWLQDINEADANAEGARYAAQADGAGMEQGERDKYGNVTALEYFRKLWDSINGDSCAWSSNPRVWVIEFERIEP